MNPRPSSSETFIRRSRRRRFRQESSTIRWRGAKSLRLFSKSGSLWTPPSRKFIYAVQNHDTLRRDCMHKDELINLHQMLSDVKDYFEEINPNLKFTQYNALKITPSQQHKSKMEHKYAIFVLGTEIANAMKEVDYSSSSRISARMKELADKTLKEMDYS